MIGGFVPRPPPGKKLSPYEVISLVDKGALQRANEKMLPFAKEVATAKRGEQHRRMLATLKEDELRAVQLLSLSMAPGGIDEGWVRFAEKDPVGATAVMGAEKYRIDCPVRSITELLPRQFGGLAWEWSYRWKPNADQHALRVAMTLMGRNAEGIPNAEVLSTFMIMTMGAWVRWVDGACTTLVATPKVFSSKAMSSIAEDLYEDIHIPWPAFLVKVPEGLLSADGRNYTEIWFALFKNVERADGSFGDAAILTVSMGQEEDGEMLHRARWGEDPLRKTLFESDAEVEGEAFTKAEERILCVAARVVVGLLHTMQYTNNFKVKHDRPIRSRFEPRTGPPDHRTVIFGSPITVDTRQVLKDWVRHGNGRSAPPSVQSLVRGHYKRQVVGLSRSGRKVIWVEPYWRGPEDAPIIAHAYRTAGGAT